MDFSAAIDNLVHMYQKRPKRQRVQRIQTGIRLEKRMVKVLKALAEYFDMSLGELLEVIILQSLDGAEGFSAGTLRKVAELKKVYDMDFTLEQAREKMFR